MAKQSCCCRQATTPTATPSKTKATSKINKHLCQGLIGLGAGLAILALCLSGITLPALAMYCLAAVSTAIIIALGKDSYLQVYYSIIDLVTQSYAKLFPSAETTNAVVTTRRPILTADSLFVLSTSAALIATTLAIFLPALGLPMMYDAALMIFGCRHLGQWFKTRLLEQVKDPVKFQDLAPTSMIIINQNQETTVNVHDLQQNQIITIKIPQNTQLILPIAATVIQSTGNIYANLTNIAGHNNPQLIAPQQQLSAATILSTDSDIELTVKVTEQVTNSYLAKIDNTVTTTMLKSQAHHSVTALDRQANTIIAYLLPIVLVSALVTALMLCGFGWPILALKAAIAILTTVCPCTLGLIPGLAIDIAHAKAKKLGLTLNNDQAVEKFATMDIIVFDLNGTLIEKNSNTTNIDIYPGAQEIISSLTKRNKEVHLCTGSDQNTADHYAQQFKIAQNNIGYQQLAMANDQDKQNNKLNYIDFLKRTNPNKKVAMIGDSLNDIPAMTKADFSIFINNNDDHAKSIATSMNKVADATFMRNTSSSLAHIITALDDCESCIKHAQFNINCSLGYNIIVLIALCIVFPCLGIAVPPALGAFFMLIQAALLAGNTWYFTNRQNSSSLNQHQTIPPTVISA